MYRLKNKKVILYGDERYIKDFIYVFDYINIEKIIYEKNQNDILNFKYINKCDKKEIFIIICKYNKDNVLLYLNKNGYTYNENYATAASFFYNLDFPIEKISQDKKLYIWGTGYNSYEFYNTILKNYPNINVQGYIDSDIEKQNKTFEGYKIYSPKEIIFDNDCFFIIASKKYFLEIRQLLEKNNKQINKHFISYLAINTYASQMMRKTIYDIPKCSYICNKPFKQAELKPEGKLLICGGMPYIMEKITPLYYCDWEDIWLSNIMKIVRLSVINGTYSFCNTYNCSYISESPYCEYDLNNIYNEYDKTRESYEYNLSKKLLNKNTILNIESYNLKANDYPEVFQCGWDESCNLHCPSCRKEVYYAPNNRKEELTNYTNRMRDLLYNNAKRIKIAGLGEALASEYYKKLIFDKKLAKKVGKLGLLSNGYLATPDVIDDILSIWKDVNVFISMDGATKYTAENLRAGIDFEKWKQNMKYIGELKKDGKINKLAFNFVVQRDNYKEMPDYTRMCLEFNADYIKFSKVFNWGNWSDSEYKNITMFDLAGRPNKELQDLINDNPILKCEKVHLFKWVNW